MSTAGNRPNILLIIADDLGQDVVKVTRSGTTRQLDVVTYADRDPDNGLEIRGELPTISRFLRNGLLFRSTWAQAACSPTRASIFTGLHPWKHGVGSPNDHVLSGSRSVVTLPEMLPGEYACGLFGKWHLGGDAGSRPTDHGWDKYQGALGGQLPLRDDNGYNDWPRVDSDEGYSAGGPNETSHATWVTVRDAAAWINSIRDLDSSTPWFATIAFNAPHKPFHVPWISGTPGAGIGFAPETVGDPESDVYKFNVMTQNMDYNIGRLIGTVSGGFANVFDFPPITSDQLDNTIIIFLGDNGSPLEIAPREHKSEVFEGGIRVPMIIADGRAVLQEILGFGIAPMLLAREKLDNASSHMVHVVDLFKTIVRLADPETAAFSVLNDSEDLGSLFTHPSDPPPVRGFNFAQYFDSGKQIATIRNDAYKLNFLDGEDTAYSLFRYEGNRIPGEEVPGTEMPGSDETPPDLFGDALSGDDADAAANLNILLEELIGNYRLNEEGHDFPEPR